jgi:hypothetical protein
MSRLIVNLGFALLIVLLAGCNTRAGREAIAVDSAEQLRKAFNNSTCQRIYEEIIEGSDKVKQDWLGGCQRLHENLGLWDDLSNPSGHALPGDSSTVRVDGIAGFTDGIQYQSYRLESYWHVKNSRARLYFLYLEGGGKQLSLPTAVSPPRGPRDLPVNPEGI